MLCSINTNIKPQFIPCIVSYLFWKVKECVLRHSEWQRAQVKAQQALSSTKQTDSKVIFSAQKRAKKIPWRSQQISLCPYTVLRCFWFALAHCSPSLSLSLVWDDSQVPPRTPCLINHPYFNICKAQRLYPSLRWALLSHTRRALRDDKTHYCLSSSEEESLFSSTLFWQKASEGQL